MLDALRLQNCWLASFAALGIFTQRDNPRMTEQETERFCEHIRSVWYSDGCDIKSSAPGEVHVGLPPRLDISTFCADIANEPFNAVALLQTTTSYGTIAVCMLDVEPNLVVPTPQSSRWITILMGVLSLLLFVLREWCGGSFDQCLETIEVEDLTTL